VDALVGTGREVEDVYPLAPMQEGMLFHTLYQPGGGAYVGQIGFDLLGPLDTAAFERAWKGVMARHAALRTGFAWDGLDRPLQVVHRGASLEFATEDWRALPEAEREARWDAFLAADRTRGFDPQRPPLMRIGVFRTGDEAHRTVWTHHQMMLDGWSVPLVFGEVAALYGAYSTGTEAALGPVHPYRGYIAWLERRDPAESEDFWRGALGSFGAPTPFGFDHPATPGVHGAAETVLRLPEAQTDSLRRMTRQHGITPNTLVQGAWALLLSRFGGEDDVVFGSTVSGRPPELEGVDRVVGLFINTLPVRVRAAPGAAVVPWLHELQETNAAVREHAYVPITRVQRWSGVPAGQPLFESVVVFDNYPVPREIGSGKRTLEVVRLPSREQGDLPMMLAASFGAELAIHVEYRRARFDPDAVERMLGHLARVLGSMAAHPERPLSGLELLSAAERSQVLAGWNPAAPAPAGPLVHELFSDRARRSPDAPALRAGGESVSYAALEERSDRLARVLRRRGVGPEVRVAVCAHRSPALVAGVLAVLKAGGAYVPLDPAYPRERLAFTLADSAAPVLLAQEGLLERLPAADARVVLLDGSGEGEDGADDDLPGSAAGPENLAYVIYTSGSTGTPKGVRVEHRGLAATLLRAQDAFGFRPGDEIPSLASAAFDIWLFEVLLPLLHGAAVRLVPADRVLDMDALGEELADVTLLHAVPALMRQVVEHADGAGMALPRLRQAFVGGDAVPPDLLRRMRAAFPGAAVQVLYGPTEGTVICASIRVDSADSLPGQMVGRPLGNAAMYVCDAWGEPVPAGIGGELYLGGPSVARDYLGRPGLTAARFVPDPFSGEAGARLYRTGDRVRWLEDGSLAFLGRTDQQVKVRGFRVEPGEVEAALERHPAVREAVVVVREDAPGDRRLVAYLVAAGARAPSAGDLREHLGASVPEHMVPSAFVPLDAFPLSPNGKVDRRALPAPEGGAAGGRVYVAPRTPAETALAAVWARVLRVERVGALDNFFELGGDSILSIQLVSRARRAGLHLTPRQLFEHPTLAELARVVGTAAEVRAEQAAVVGPVEMTPVQAWFFSQPVPERHRFNMTEMFSVRRPLDVPVLERAVARLLEHHDALRLRFAARDGAWSQENAPPDGGAPVTRIDLARVPEERQAEALERAADQLQGSLDLARGPLLRAGYFVRGEGRSGRLLVAVHHLVTDGVSWRILLEDLQAAYAQASRGEPVSLPAKTTSFRAWAARLAEHARAGGFDGELPYWAAEARAGVPPLPLDFPEGAEAGTAASSRSVDVSLPPDETRALLQDVPRAYRTRIDDVLLTALARALAGWTGEGRVLVEMEGHGREELFPDVDLSRTVGWFTTAYPVLLDVGSAPGEGASLKAVKEQLRAVPGRGIGYGALRWLVGGEAGERLAALPAPQVSFNYLGQVDGAVGPDGPREALFGRAPESVGSDVGARLPRRHLLGVSGVVEGGRLRMSFGYGASAHRRETVEELAGRFLAELRGLVAHCTAEGAGGHTPSDFPLAGLTQARVDALLGSDPGIEDVYPLAPLQEGMLFHTLMEEAGGLFVAQFGFDLLGELDVDAFERAWRAAVERHPVLRTDFVWQGVDRPLQVVRRRVALPVAREDWRGLPAAEREARRAEYLRQDRERGFDAGRAPLLRLALFRTGEAEHHLVWTQHHLTLDGWSIPILFRDVASFYVAFAQGRAAQLPPVRPYRDYMAWLARQDGARAEAFWREALAGFAAPIPVRAARGSAPPAGDGDAGEGTGYRRAQLHLPPGASEAVRSAGRRLETTVNTLVQGAWALLLARYAGEDDVVFGTTVSGRPAELDGVEEMVGLFINTLPVRVRVPARERVEPWLRALQDHNVALREHGYSPLAEVQRWSEVPAGEPLFESVVVFDNYPVGREIGSGAHALRVVPREGVEQANYPLVVGGLLGDDLTLYVEYAHGVFESTAEAGRTLARLAGVLEWMAADPRAPLADAPLLTAAERREVLTGWSAGPEDHAPPVPLHERVAAWAARAPDAVAVTFEGEALTYAELDARANRLARFLRGRGVSAEARVALFMERGPELWAAVLAVWKAGGTYVPLDPAYPARRIGMLLEDSAPALLLAQERLLDRLPSGAASPVVLERERARVAGESGAPVEGGSVPGSAAYVIYTSGSTGTPKGVVVEHRGLAAVVRAQEAAFGLGPDDRVLQFASPGFDASVFEMAMALAPGGTLVLASRERLLPGDPLAGLLREERVTAAVLPPSALAVLPVQELPALRLLTVAGEDCPAELVERWGAARRFVNLYGPTEATIWGTAAECSPGGGRPPIGRPVAGRTAYVLDRAGEPVPAGVPGELYLGGAGVARGYLGRPGQTAERFVPDPFGRDAGARLYRTGDRARWRADGVLEFLGRVDQQVKIRGFRIEPGEVESALLGHPRVREAAVVARADGPGGGMLAAYVAARDGDDAPTPEELRAWLRERLPEYMLPAAVVLLERIPLTPSGKTDRRALPVPGAESRALREYVAPRSALEEVLAEIWKEVLGVDRAGAHDSFFELGGHSLLVTRAISRMRETLLAEIPLRVLFDAPTLAELAGAVTRYEANPGDMDRIARMLRMVAAMSAEDVQRMLAAKTDPPRSAR
jgi:amino acid adenylation domain-containing protein/non-ribosomal peptide synthase protein (TIGR01720 family)